MYTQQLSSGRLYIFVFSLLDRSAIAAYSDHACVNCMMMWKMHHYIHMLVCALEVLRLVGSRLLDYALTPFDVQFMPAVLMSVDCQGGLMPMQSQESKMGLFTVLALM